MAKQVFNCIFGKKMKNKKHILNCYTFSFIFLLRVADLHMLIYSHENDNVIHMCNICL